MFRPPFQKHYAILFPVMKMVVYIDLLMGLNSLLDYLLLTVCGRVTASPCRRRRMVLAGVLGGIYAAMTLLKGFSFLRSLFWQAVFALMLCLVAFGPGRGLMRQTVVFLLLGAAFSGIVLVLTELFSAPKAFVGGRIYYPVSLGVLVLTAGGAYGLMRWGLGRLTHQGGDIASVRLTIGTGSVEFTALRDTGNTLHDPVSGLPVLVVDASVLKRLLPGRGEDALSWLMLLQGKAPELQPRLIPYKTVSSSDGLMPAFRPKEVQIDGKRENLLIGISTVNVSDGGGYSGLLGGKL